MKKDKRNPKEKEKELIKRATKGDLKLCSFAKFKLYLTFIFGIVRVCLYFNLSHSSCRYETDDERVKIRRKSMLNGRNVIKECCIAANGIMEYERKCYKKLCKN